MQKINALLRSRPALRLGNATRAYYVFLSFQLVAILLLVAWYCMIYQKDRATNLKRLTGRLADVDVDEKRSKPVSQQQRGGGSREKSVNGRFLYSSIESRQNGRRKLTLNVTDQKQVAMAMLLRANLGISIATIPPVHLPTAELLEQELATTLPSIAANLHGEPEDDQSSSAALAMSCLRLRGIMRGYDDDGVDTVLRLRSLSACKSVLQDGTLYSKLGNRCLRELLEDIVLFYGGELQHDAAVIISKVLAMCPVEGQQALLTLIAYAADDDTAVTSTLRLIAYRLPMTLPDSPEAETILKMLLVIISRPCLSMAHHDYIKRALSSALRPTNAEAVRHDAQLALKKYKEWHSFAAVGVDQNRFCKPPEVCV